MRRRVAVSAVGLLTLAVGTSACGLSKGVYDVPLPGGADVGSHPYSLSANFTDVLDLVPQSAVKVDNVAVGRVSTIRLNPDGRSARVRMTLNDSVKLPVGTTARLQQTSLLGEKYVALVRPGDPSSETPLGTTNAATTTTTARTTDTGTLHNGDVLPLSKTSQAVGIEQVLGALSLLLNGGGIGQFQEISRELQAVSAGRPDQVRAFLDKTASFVTDLNQRRDAITSAIDGLAALGTTLDTQQPEIKAALDNLSPGLKVLADQRGELVKMLTALDKLSTVSVDTLHQAQDDIVASLKRLDPILTQLAKSGAALPQALQILFTYPFPDSVLGAIKGDYLNVYLTMNLATPGGPWTQPDSLWPTGTPIPAQAQALAVPGLGTPSSSSAGTSTPMILPSTSSAAPGVGSPTLPTTPKGTASSTPTDQGTATTPTAPGTSTSPTDPGTSTAPTDPGMSSAPTGPADPTPSASSSAAAGAVAGGS